MFGAGRDRPSLAFMVDPVSSQPLLVVYGPSEGHRLYPLDKVVRSPYEHKSPTPDIRKG